MGLIVRRSKLLSTPPPMPGRGVVQLNTDRCIMHPRHENLATVILIPIINKIQIFQVNLIIFFKVCTQPLTCLSSWYTWAFSRLTRLSPNFSTEDSFTSWLYKSLHIIIHSMVYKFMLWLESQQEVNTWSCIVYGNPNPMPIYNTRFSRLPVSCPYK